VSRVAPQTRLRRPDLARRMGRIAQYLAGGAALAALCLAGHDLLPRHTQGGARPAVLTGQFIPTSQVSALLTHARAHDPALRLPHAHWFIRIRHGHPQVVVIEHATGQGAGGTRTAQGGSQQ